VGIQEIEAYSSQAADTVWVEDALPAGATPASSEPWEWIGAEPAPFSGIRALRSPITAGLHQYAFTGATAALRVNPGDMLFAYAYLDPDNAPSEIMLQWQDGTDWEHRAYWGTNAIDLGVDGTDSRRYMGPLPAPGQWVRLEVPAGQVGLAGKTLTGMAFTTYGERRLDLDWMTDALLVVQYKAKTRYLR
jgi:hypothetical protein